VYVLDFEHECGRLCGRVRFLCGIVGIRVLRFVCDCDSLRCSGIAVRMRLRLSGNCESRKTNISNFKEHHFSHNSRFICSSTTRPPTTRQHKMFSNRCKRIRLCAQSQPQAQPTQIQIQILSVLPLPSPIIALVLECVFEPLTIVETIDSDENGVWLLSAISNRSTLKQHFVSLKALEFAIQKDYNALFKVIWHTSVSYCTALQ